MITERYRWYKRKRVVHRCHTGEEASKFITSELRLAEVDKVKAVVRPVDGMHKTCIEFYISQTRYNVLIWN